MFRSYASRPAPQSRSSRRCKACGFGSQQCMRSKSSRTRRQLTSHNPCHPERAERVEGPASAPATTLVILSERSESKDLLLLQPQPLSSLSERSESKDLLLLEPQPLSS